MSRTGTGLYGSFLTNNCSTKFVTRQRFSSRGRVGPGNQKIEGTQWNYWSGERIVAFAESGAEDAHNIEREILADSHELRDLWS